MGLSIHLSSWSKTRKPFLIIKEKLIRHGRTSSVLRAVTRLISRDVQKWKFLLIRRHIF